MLFHDLARLSLDIKATPSRLATWDLIGAFLKSLHPDEIRPAVLMLMGRVTPFGQKPLEVSGAALSKVLKSLQARAPTASQDYGAAIRSALEHALPTEPTLRLMEVHERLLALTTEKGKGSAGKRVDLLAGLFRQCTPDEAEVLARIVLRDMRHGANEGTVLESLARAADIPRDKLARAQMLVGDLSEIARIALLEGPEAIDHIALAPFRPLKPMLAQKAESVTEALAICGGRASLEYKLDGARLQVHRRDDQVRLFTRRLSEVTDSLPDVTAYVLEHTSSSDFIAEGELIPLGPGGRPVAFQELMRRFHRVHDVQQAATEVPTRLYLFDLLAREGEELIDHPLQLRWQQLEALVRPSGHLRLVPRIVTDDPQQGEAFYADAVQRGYEGVMAKDLGSPYTPGVRGKAWLKIKQAHTLDVVVVAADWGYGRRSGWLSNYHLAVKAPEGLTEIGKTFKGMSDAEFEDITKRLQSLQDGPQRGSTVPVRPEIVLEVAFSDIQRSPQYACGYALRFARVVRVRDDKSPRDIDAIDTVEFLYQRQLAADF